MQDYTRQEGLKAAGTADKGVLTPQQPGGGSPLGQTHVPNQIGRAHV